MKTYSELVKMSTFNDRLDYLKLLDNNATSPRHMSEQFYKSRMWKQIRKQVIDRDLSFDLGVFGVYIPGNIYVHHINPINEADILYCTDKLINPENLITVSLSTHNRIHYNREEREEYVERTPGDTKLW